MAILLPTNLTQDNPLYPTVYFSDIKGNAWATGSDGNQYGIPEAKRELGMIVYFSSSQNFKYYKGNSTTSADWASPLSWSMFGGGESVNTGSLLLTASATLNTITFTKGDNITQFTITVDTGSGQTYTEGNGITITNNIISSDILTVNGQGPNESGNITTALTAVLTGDSSSLIASSSGPNTGSITNGTVWVISGDGDATKNGDSYIFKSGSLGEWYQISPLDEVAADARYVRLSAASTQNITSSLVIDGSTTFSGSLLWSGSSNANGAAANVVVLSNGQLYVTGAYGGGGGTGTNVIKAGAVSPITFNGTPRTASVVFTSNMADINYGVSIMSGDARVWTIDNKAVSGFTINSNSSVILTTSASWIAAPTNNPL